jgi:hypothetical protein
MAATATMPPTTEPAMIGVVLRELLPGVGSVLLVEEAEGALLDDVVAVG